MIEILNQYAGALQAVIALAALVVSAYAIHSGREALRLQREHNIISMRPDLTIIISDYNDKIRIQIKNNGLGPGRITEQRFFKNGALQDVDKFVDLMPVLSGPVYWTHFCSNVKDVLLAPGSMRNLIEFSGNAALENPDIVLEIRRALAPLHIEIDYEDYYNQPYSVEKSLDWYARYLTDDAEKQWSEK